MCKNNILSFTIFTKNIYFLTFKIIYFDLYSSSNLGEGVNTQNPSSGTATDCTYILKFEMLSVSQTKINKLLYNDVQKLINVVVSCCNFNKVPKFLIIKFYFPFPIDVRFFFLVEYLEKCSTSKTLFTNISLHLYVCKRVRVCACIQESERQDKNDDRIQKPRFHPLFI